MNSYERIYNLLIESPEDTPVPGQRGATETTPGVEGGHQQEQFRTTTNPKTGRTTKWVRLGRSGPWRRAGGDKRSGATREAAQRKRK